MTAAEPSTNEDARAQALAVLCDLQSRFNTSAEAAGDYPNRFAPEPSCRLDNAIRYVNGAIAVLGGEV